MLGAATLLVRYLVVKTWTLKLETWRLKVEGWNLKLYGWNFSWGKGFNWRDSFNWIQLSSMTLLIHRAHLLHPYHWCLSPLHRLNCTIIHQNTRPRHIASNTDQPTTTDHDPIKILVIFHSPVSSHHLLGKCQQLNETSFINNNLTQQDHLHTSIPQLHPHNRFNRKMSLDPQISLLHSIPKTSIYHEPMPLVFLSSAPLPTVECRRTNQSDLSSTPHLSVDHLSYLI